ncbi:MAG TPA: ribosome maturation factor RimP [Elusimicrobiales bacterium]|nr:ribosome maturation factor RimP [Elusimicrobiales bacterium]
MDSTELEKKLEPIFKDTGFDIADIKIYRAKSLVVQIFIDKMEGNVTLKDCEEWSDKIVAYIDMNSVITTSYVLEVSSPGVDRIIKKPSDFIRFKGKDVKITLKKPFDGSRVYYSKIVDFKENTAYFEDNLKFSMDEIQEVRLNPDDTELFKKIN